MTRFGRAVTGPSVGPLTNDLFGLDPGQTALASVGVGAFSQSGLFHPPLDGAPPGGLVGHGLEPSLGASGVPLGVFAGSAIGTSLASHNQAERYGYYDSGHGYAGYGHGDYEYGYRLGLQADVTFQ